MSISRQYSSIVNTALSCRHVHTAVRRSFCLVTNDPRNQPGYIILNKSFSATADSGSVQYPHRHSGIKMHGDSISRTILPGNMIERTNSKGLVQKRYTELVHGYFWMLKDLQRTNEKPVLSNEALISESIAKVFPQLKSLQSLSGDYIDLPDHCLRKNRSKDPSAQCTLVAVSFRDFGFRQLSSWIDPFKTALGHKDRVELLKLSMNEGWFAKWILRKVIKMNTKANTPDDEVDNTYLYFGSSNSDLEAFRDSLRMHNVMSGFVFLLDGLGRVRFAGSGTATEYEAAKLIELAKEITPLLRPAKGRLAGISRSGRKVRK